LRVRFGRPEFGWIDIDLGRGTATYRLDGLSYLTSVLDDVLAAALRVCTGDWRGAADFELEPGLMRLVCECRRDNETSEKRTFLRVLENDSAFSAEGLPDDRFELRWEVELDSPDEFARAVLDGAKALGADVGHQGYAEAWIMSPFPVRAVAALEAALAIEPPPEIEQD
jgi:hypothetical protein